MSGKAPHPFLERLEQLSAVAQNGLTFAADPFDLERYRKLRALTAEMMALLADLPQSAVEGWLTLDRDYATPKLDVRAIVLRGSEVLLVQERSDRLWTPPGGWCDVGRSPGAAVEQEVREEAGLEVRATRLLALYDKRKHDHPFQIPHACKCYFLCEEEGGALLEQSGETLAAGFFRLDSLPPLSLHRSTPRQLQRVVRLALAPAAPAEFD